MSVYYVSCEDKKGRGPGYQYTEINKAVLCASDAWKSGRFDTVIIQLESAYRSGMYFKVWKDGKWCI